MVGFVGRGCAAINPFANLEEWKEIHAQKFIMYTNAEEVVGLAYVKELEAFRAIALEITVIHPFEETNPLRVYLFKDKRSFSPFQLPRNVAGYFLKNTNYIVLFAYSIKGNSLFPVIYHEYIHYLIAQRPANIPHWYNEGLATMFETVSMQRGRLTFGEPNQIRSWYMKYHARWIPMDKLLSDQTNFLNHSEGTDSYSQAWALMHYFFYRSDESLDKLGQYIYLVNNGYDFDDALQKTFGLTPEGLLEEMRVYVAQENLVYSTIQLEDIVIDDHHDIHSLDQDEAQEVIQDLLDLVQG